ncbi:MAG: hypothetical protein L0Z73_07985, partial [Gammaproteobacteria bacterium]|nr:hypothetical protein [Gammaproteobacteria bacterium]
MAGSNVSTDEYPWWTKSFFVRKVVFEWRISGFWAGVTVFAVYWCVPLVFALISGTVLPRPILEEWSSMLSANFPDVSPEAKYFNGLAHDQKLHYLTDLAYLTDKTHFFFALVISVGAGIATHVVRNVNTTIIKLRQRAIPLADEAELKAVYARYRDLAAHKGFKIMSLILGLLAGAIFYSMSRATSYSDWWGYHEYGYAGVAFAFVEALMVYWGMRTVILMGMGSIMLASFIRRPLVLRPFHPDGCNGLSPLGQQIIFLWIFSLTLAFAIYVTISIGYLGIEKTLIVWVLAVLGTVSIPALAILPLFAALKSIQSAQRFRLAHFEQLLNELLDKTEQLV